MCSCVWKTISTNKTEYGERAREWRSCVCCKRLNVCAKWSCFPSFVQGRRSVTSLRFAPTHEYLSADTSGERKWCCEAEYLDTDGSTYGTLLPASQLFLTVLVMWRLTDEEQFGEASSDTVLLVGRVLLSLTCRCHS